MAACRSGRALTHDTSATSSIALPEAPLGLAYVTPPLEAQGESSSTFFSSTSVQVLYGFDIQLSAPLTDATAPAKAMVAAIRRRPVTGNLYVKASRPGSKRRHYRRE